MTTALELFGVLCLAVLAFFVWPPLVLVVVGVAAFVASFVIERSDKP